MTQTYEGNALALREEQPAPLALRPTVHETVEVLRTYISCHFCDEPAVFEQVIDIWGPGLVNRIQTCGCGTVTKI